MDLWEQPKFNLNQNTNISIYNDAYGIGVCKLAAALLSSTLLISYMITLLAPRQLIQDMPMA